MHKNIKKVLFTEEQITNRSKELGAMITKDYQKEGVTPLVVALLKGSVPFLAEIIKYIDLDIRYDFMDVTSYDGTESIGDLKIVKDLNVSIQDVDILLVEDIVDTGTTIDSVVKLLKNKGAHSVKIVTLLDKPSRRSVDIQADYVGFEVSNEFVVGFGMDYNQDYRNLPYVGVLKDECYQ